MQQINETGRKLLLIQYFAITGHVEEARSSEEFVRL